MSASLLPELVLAQRAIANSSTVNSITPSSLNPSVASVPTTMDLWVNGLRFTSLFLSLTTALVAVPVKQRLHHYVALPSGTPHDRSLTRQFRYAGLQKWHVQIIIGLLSAFMHLGLALFLVGLVVFLHSPHEALSRIVCTGTLGPPCVCGICDGDHPSHVRPSIPVPYTFVVSFIFPFAILCQI
ncbi:hypothetical protein IW262DRAFT_552926 [Armillaria fumosa]|nr:hypothetical protein IW262DRAFT_552926 [Armillaria fumosa]